MGWAIKPVERNFVERLAVLEKVVGSIEVRGMVRGKTELGKVVTTAGNGVVSDHADGRVRGEVQLSVLQRVGEIDKGGHNIYSRYFVMDFLRTTWSLSPRCSQVAVSDSDARGASSMSAATIACPRNRWVNIPHLTDPSRRHDFLTHFGLCRKACFGFILVRGRGVRTGNHPVAPTVPKWIVFFDWGATRVLNVASTLITRRERVQLTLEALVVLQLTSAYFSYRMTMEEIPVKTRTNCLTRREMLQTDAAVSSVAAFGAGALGVENNSPTTADGRVVVNGRN